MIDNREYGLVLAGGGTKGAYQVGVWKALCELGINIKAIVGASIGALNGALFLQNDICIYRINNAVIFIKNQYSIISGTFKSIRIKML